MGNSSDLKSCRRCEASPCICAAPASCTKCDGDTTNNVWVERGPFPGDEKRIGICLLDTMKPYQIIYSLEHDFRAQQDLLRVTTDPYLLYLANNVTLLPTQELVDMEQRFLNRPDVPGSYPYYGVFAGRAPLPQVHHEGDPVDDE